MMACSIHTKNKKKMTIKERIEADFIAAYKNKETAKKDFLGLLKSEIKNDEGRGVPATDDNVIKRLKGIEKGLIQVQEATKSETAATELAILREYLPQQMSEETIMEIVEGIIGDGGDLKVVMLHFKEVYPGRVDNKLLSDIARQVISKKS